MFLNTERTPYTTRSMPNASAADMVLPIAPYVAIKTAPLILYLDAPTPRSIECVLIDIIMRSACASKKSANVTQVFSSWEWTLPTGKISGTKAWKSQKMSIGTSQTGCIRQGEPPGHNKVALMALLYYPCKAGIPLAPPCT